MIASWIDKFWYQKHPVRWGLLPCSWVYQLIVFFRRLYLQRFLQIHFPVPVLIVGNITVGGVGKTPLVIAIAEHFRAKNLRVGIISRGYGARIQNFPHEVSLNDDAQAVGDEPLLIAEKTHCPVVIAPNRQDAVRYLLQMHQSQLIISDDGLQHYALGRAIEIVVIDGKRGLGNKLCLPAGPLRESPKRLTSVDLLVVNGGEWPHAFQMTVAPMHLIHMTTGRVVDPRHLKGSIAAVAAIGHPQRFFSTLKELEIEFQPYVFSDHHPFRAHELALHENNIIMTEKDAVKCRGFVTDNMFFLSVKAALPEEFWSALDSQGQLQGLT